jgi:hypothetical protein
LAELEEAVKQDAKTQEKGRIGSKVGSWIGKMLTRAGSGGWKMATTVGGNLLTKAIAAYYDLD